MLLAFPLAVFSTCRVQSILLHWLKRLMQETRTHWCLCLRITHEFSPLLDGMDTVLQKRSPTDLTADNTGFLTVAFVLYAIGSLASIAVAASYS